MAIPPTPSKLDSSQCIQGSYVDTDGALRVNVNAPLSVSGDVLVDISANDNDSVLVYGTQDGTPTGTKQILKVNSDGSINVDSGGGSVTSNQGSPNTVANSWPIKVTDGIDTALVTSSGELNVLATAQPGIDIGDVTVNNTSGIGAVNIQDGGNSITVDGTITANAGTGTFLVDGSAHIQPISGSVSVSNFPATQAVTQSTSPWVVSGTVTANAGANLNTSALQLDTTGAKLTLGQASTTSGQTGPLIQGAVTTNQPSYTTGQTDPISLTLRGGIRSKGIGLDSVFLIRNDYSSVNVTTAAYTQLLASSSLEVNRLMIFDSSGQDLVLATGGVGSEVDQIQIAQGGWDFPIELFIPASTRISIKSKSSTANAGILLITGLK